MIATPVELLHNSNHVSHIPLRSPSAVERMRCSHRVVLVVVEMVVVKWRGTGRGDACM
jgi:hypothetical protein